MTMGRFFLSRWKISHDIHISIVRGIKLKHGLRVASASIITLLVPASLRLCKVVGLGDITGTHSDTDMLKQ